MVRRRIRIAETTVRFCLGPLLRQGFVVHALFETKAYISNFRNYFVGEVVSSIALAKEGLPLSYSGSFGVRSTHKNNSERVSSESASRRSRRATHLFIMYYVYLARCIKDKSYYTGTTTDLKRRFNEHNNGSARYTSSKGIFILIWYCAFSNKQAAYDFEKYLKSGSGTAFRNKHLIFK